MRCIQTAICMCASLSQALEYYFQFVDRCDPLSGGLSAGAAHALATNEPGGEPSEPSHILQSNDVAPAILSLFAVQQDASCSGLQSQLVAALRQQASMLQQQPSTQGPGGLSLPRSRSTRAYRVPTETHDVELTTSMCFSAPRDTPHDLAHARGSPGRLYKVHVTDC